MTNFLLEFGLYCNLLSVLLTKVEGQRLLSQSAYQRELSSSLLECLDLWEKEEVSFSSPGFEQGSYANDMRVTYLIKAPPGIELSMRCSNFRLQMRNPWTGNCSDYLELPQNVNLQRRSRVKQFCGIDIVNHAFVSSSSLENDRILFFSDESGTEGGFRCQLRRKSLTELIRNGGKSIYANLMTTSVSRITSPPLDANPNTQYQAWIYTIMSPKGSKVLLSCEEFAIPTNWKCLQEYLLINEIRYCGSLVPKNLLLHIPDGTYNITYVNNIDKQSEFRCTVIRFEGLKDSCSSRNVKIDKSLKIRQNLQQGKRQPECIDLITPISAVIQSEGFGFQNYTTNLESSHFIMAPLASTITMDCNNFNVELSHWCRKDYLTIDSELWPLVRYCGNQYKGRKTLEDRNVIRFVSDGNVTGSGYQCFLKKHSIKVNHHVNLMATNVTWIAYNQRADPSKWLNSRKQEIFLITAPEGSLLNFTCSVFNVRCGYSEDLHFGTKLYGESLCDGSPHRSIIVNYNLANNTVVLTDDLRTSSNFNCTITRIGGDYGPCSYPTQSG